MTEAAIDMIVSSNNAAKTKEQKRQEGRRRALEIAIAKQSKESNTPHHDDNTTAFTGESKRRGGNNRKSDRHGARNQHRHKHFARWILDKFPHVVSECSSSTPSASEESARTTAATNTTRHLLDIAGGKGELSARLTLCHSLRVVMIDPRPADIPSVYLKSVVPKLPKKWQHSLEERLRTSPMFVEEELDKRFVQLVTHFSIANEMNFCSGGTDDDGGVDNDTNDDVEMPLFQDEAVEKAVRDASLIIGLHADGATEAIVDAALRYDKPFVIVPCCVFPNFFRHRFIYVDDVDGGDDTASDGNEKKKEKKKVAVRTHGQFCQYLLDKDDRFRREVLPFEGRNVVIWWDGK